ncbi:hypothetical protein [Geomicrobium sp. JCM 19055]|uniref:hypothetical protein n=1 Tax=Geomicrobium sp. JCM 19055 TaxID=1460649 RepID=UPI0012697E81
MDYDFDARYSSIGHFSNTALSVFFENFHLSQVEDELSNHASFIVATIEQGEGQPQSFRSVRQLEHAHGMKVVIFREHSILDDRSRCRRE